MRTGLSLLLCELRLFAQDTPEHFAPTCGYEESGRWICSRSMCLRSARKSAAASPISQPKPGKNLVAAPAPARWAPMRRTATSPTPSRGSRARTGSSRTSGTSAACCEPPCSPIVTLDLWIHARCVLPLFCAQHACMPNRGRGHCSRCCWAVTLRGTEGNCQLATPLAQCPQGRREDRRHGLEGGARLREGQVALQQHPAGALAPGAGGRRQHDAQVRP